VGEREGMLRPSRAHERDACPQRFALEGYFAPEMAHMTDCDPMWGADGTVLRESSGRVKVAVEGSNSGSVIVIEQWHIAHYFGENFDRKESDRVRVRRSP